MEYIGTNWVDGETPLNQSNMNKIEAALSSISQSKLSVSLSSPSKNQVIRYNGGAWVNEASGYTNIKTLSDLYGIEDSILSRSGINTDNDSLGQEWYVLEENKKYTLVDWGNRRNSLGWQPTVIIPEDLTSNVNSLMDAVFPLTITSFSGLGGTYELGSSQSITVSWGYDRTIDSQNINGVVLGNSVRSRAFPSVGTPTTYTLTATSGSQTVTRSGSITFRLKKYYGTSNFTSLTNSQILSLTNTWAERTQSLTDFNCAGGKYPYYVIPTSMISGIQFWIGGLRNTDWNQTQITLINSVGYSESYTVFRLNTIQTGILSIEVK